MPQHNVDKQFLTTTNIAARMLGTQAVETGATLYKAAADASLSQKLESVRPLPRALALQRGHGPLAVILASKRRNTDQ